MPKKKVKRSLSKGEKGYIMRFKKSVRAEKVKTRKKLMALEKAEKKANRLLKGGGRRGKKKY